MDGAHDREQDHCAECGHPIDPVAPHCLYCGTMLTDWDDAPYESPDGIYWRTPVLLKVVAWIALAMIAATVIIGGFVLFS